MPLAVKRTFGLEAIAETIEEASNGTPNGDPFAEKANGIGVGKYGDVKFHGGRALLENGKDGRIYKGLGSLCGPITLPSGETLDAGRLLMQDTWNAALYLPLDSAFEEGSKLMDVLDVWIHKNRMSGMWGGTAMCMTNLTALGTTSFTPPPLLARAPKFQIRYAHPTSLGCHQLHMVIVAKLQELSRSAFVRSVVIFVKYHKVSTHIILPNFIGNCKDSVIFIFW